MYSRILVPLDGTPGPEAAIPHAVALANQFGATLHVLRVVETDDRTFYMGGKTTAGLSEMPLVGEVDIRLSEEEAIRYLRRVSDLLLDKAQVPIRTQVVRGEPAKAIVKVANETGASLIVMTAHFYAGLAHLLKREVAQSVFRHSDLPVLVVHPH